MSRSNILFVLTGSIAAYKACDAISQLVQRGHRVRTVATPSALHFVGVATLEGLTGEPVRRELFEPGQAMDHIHLARWADAMIVGPATANSLNRFAAGLADDLAGALFLAHDRTKPLLVAPAMNPTMWQHPATQSSVLRLKQWGVRFIPVGHGHTACGEEGEGRMAEPEVIVASIEAALARPARALRILVTSGGTSEPIDGARVLTNTSTGRTGASLAEHFICCGHDVVLLRARNSAAAPPLVREELFSTFDELDAALTRLLGAEHFDVIVHAAAVSDFRVGSIIVDGVRHSPGRHKLDSHCSLQLGLEPAPKLIESLLAGSLNPAICIVAFKLTSGAPAEAVCPAIDVLFNGAGADFVVHNDLASRGSTPDAFPADIYAADDSPAIHCPTRPALAVELERLLSTNSVPT